MTVKDLIKTTATILQLDAILSSGYFTMSTVKLTTEEDKQLQELLASLNMVNNIIATEYIPLLAETTCTVTNGKINYTSIDRNRAILNIKKVRSTDGTVLTFTCYPTYLKTEGSQVVVTYAYYPATLTETDNVTTYGIQLSDRVYAYGMAAEYCFINGMYDEASMWDKRFKDALKGVTRRLAEVRLPGKVWA